MVSKKTETTDRKMTKSILDSILRTLYIDGNIKLEDFDNKGKLADKLLRIFKKYEWAIIIDHSDNLIMTAKQFGNEKDFDKAKLFYATFFEHELNNIIVTLCRKKSIDKKTINEIIKSINLIGKLTWLPLIFDIPTVSEQHKKIILKIADDRNAYVHYKHNPQPDEIDTNREQKNILELKQIQKTVTYFKKYVSRVLYGNRKTHLDKKIKVK